MKKSYKDKCDNCGTFSYLIGFNGKCLCSKCLKKKYKQMSIYDFLEVK